MPDFYYVFQEEANKEFVKKFGDKIKSLRQEKGLSQERLAELCGTSQVQIARIESGNLNTSISNLYALAKAFEKKPYELLIDLEN